MLLAETTLFNYQHMPYSPSSIGAFLWWSLTLLQQCQHLTEVESEPWFPSVGRMFWPANWVYYAKRFNKPRWRGKRLVREIDGYGDTSCGWTKIWICLERFWGDRLRRFVWNASHAWYLSCTQQGRDRYSVTRIRAIVWSIEPFRILREALRSWYFRSTLRGFYQYQITRIRAVDSIRRASSCCSGGIVRLML